jgi:hypothetical protein
MENIIPALFLTSIVENKVLVIKIIPDHINKLFDKIDVEVYRCKYD